MTQVLTAPHFAPGRVSFPALRPIEADIPPCYPVYEQEQYSYVWNMLPPELKEISSLWFFLYGKGERCYNLYFTSKTIYVVVSDLSCSMHLCCFRQILHYGAGDL